jgi:N-acetylmuramoyl-L-alanine amidase
VPLNRGAFFNHLLYAISDEGTKFSFTMSSRSFLINLYVVLLTLFLPHNLLAVGDDTDKLSSISKRYDEAKFYYNQLQTNSNLSASRENWLKGTRNFRRIYLSSPKSDLAPACLFMLGRVYGDMHDHFHKDIDLEESISYFTDITRLFPQDRLADDGYFALAQIYLDKENNPRAAADFLIEIVSAYPNGDMNPKAEELLKLLSKEHDIPLPQIMVSSHADNSLNYVLPVKYWSSDNYTRVVIMASGPVNYKEVLLKETENTPRRLYIDFKKSYIEPQYRSPVPIEDGLLRRIRTGQFSPDTVRVVLDIESIGDYKIFNLPDPFRVVIDVRGKTSQNSISSLTSSPKLITRTKTKTKREIKNNLQIEANSNIVILRETKKYAFSSSSAKNELNVDVVPANLPISLAQQLGLGVKKIIIDPGHGGKDPGAMAFGLKEKNIVLDIAKKLVPVLQRELRCEVLLTRDQDVFIPLEERTAIANTQNADLFISLHINAHPSAKVRGLETYYLNLSTNAEAMRVAARENATSTHQMSDLQDILSDIMKNSKINESSRLAQQVHNSILTQAENNDFADIKNLGVKQAPFYVLIGAEMPAILIEIAFISNEQDANNLQDASFVNMLTQEIADGIKIYVNNTTAQLLLND